LIPVHRDNAMNRDWVILLEANTIVGPKRETLRVASATQDRRIVRKLRSLKLQLFLVVEGYDPRIHVLFFCPQLYHYDRNGTLVPMRSEEIGRYVAATLDDKAEVRPPWYGPMDQLPRKPPVTGTMLIEYDTLVVEKPATRPLLSGPADDPQSCPD
jgi:hypothetical protein